MATLKELATEMRNAFETRTRLNDQKFVALKDGSPVWMTEVCHHAHGEMLPDDWRYSFIRDVVVAIEEYDDLDEASNSFEVIYTNEMTGWLHSRADRYGYVDEAVEQLGVPDSKDFTLTTLLAWGMMFEFREVFNLVVEKLTELAEDDEETDEDA